MKAEIRMKVKRNKSLFNNSYKESVIWGLGTVYESERIGFYKLGHIFSVIGEMVEDFIDWCRKD